MTILQSMAAAIGDLDDAHRGGFVFDFHPIPGEIEVYKVSVAGREELPIFMTIADEQLLCICYLWDDAEVKPEMRAEMMEAMLDMNVPMPLSSFAKIADKYTVFGAMSVKSSAEDVSLEIATLSSNAIDAIEAFSLYLNQ